jgi:hypothetical protein
MNYFVPGLLIGFLLGAISFGLFALLLTHRKPPSITKNARREKTVDVPHTEYRRRHRDAPGRRHLYSELCEGVEELKAMREREEGVQYRFMGVTGSEDQ